MRSPPPMKSPQPVGPPQGPRSGSRATKSAMPMKKHGPSAGKRRVESPQSEMRKAGGAKERLPFGGSNMGLPSASAEVHHFACDVWTSSIDDPHEVYKGGQRDPPELQQGGRRLWPRRARKWMSIGSSIGSQHPAPPHRAAPVPPILAQIGTLRGRFLQPMCLVDPPAEFRPVFPRPADRPWI